MKNFYKTYFNFDKMDATLFFLIRNNRCGSYTMFKWTIYCIVMCSANLNIKQSHFKNDQRVRWKYQLENKES